MSGTTSRFSIGGFVVPIYTRKSTEEGLEQEFNTLDAQREAYRSVYPQSAPRGLGLPAAGGL